MRWNCCILSRYIAGGYGVVCGIGCRHRAVVINNVEICGMRIYDKRSIGVISGSVAPVCRRIRPTPPFPLLRVSGVEWTRHDVHPARREA